MCFAGNISNALQDDQWFFEMQFTVHPHTTHPQSLPNTSLCPQVVMNWVLCGTSCAPSGWIGSLGTQIFSDPPDFLRCSIGLKSGSIWTTYWTTTAFTELFQLLLLRLMLLPPCFIVGMVLVMAWCQAVPDFLQTWYRAFTPKTLALPHQTREFSCSCSESLSGAFGKLQQSSRSTIQACIIFWQILLSVYRNSGGLTKWLSGSRLQVSIVSQLYEESWSFQT